jgi:phosphatidylserine/phosphatidylglycerophosphate/cardiolipin synthase-like enzyme
MAPDDFDGLTRASCGGKISASEDKSLTRPRSSPAKQRRPASSSSSGDRGVKVRVYLAAKRLPETEGAKPFRDLAETPDVEIRTKGDNTAFMHLKSYQIDGRVLRTGAANFSASGLKREYNDLIVIESAEAAATFKRNFEARFASGETLAPGMGR